MKADEACPLVFIEPHWDFLGNGNPGHDGRCIASPDGRNVYVGRHLQHRLLVYERDAGAGSLFLVQDFECDQPAGMVVSPDGKHLYVRGGKGDTAVQAYRHDHATGKLTLLREYSGDEFRGARRP